MMKRINVLVTGAGGDIGQSIGKILGELAMVEFSLGIDLKLDSPSKFIYDQFELGVKSNSDEFLSHIEELVKRHDIGVIIPACEPDMKSFCSLPNLDLAGAKIVMASPHVFEIGSSKKRTSDFLRDNDLPFPMTQYCDEELKLSTPFIVKSDSGWGSKDLHIIRSQEDYEVFKGDRKYVAQKYLPGDDQEYTCGLYRSSSGVVRSITYLRTLTNGYSGYGEVADNESITELLEKIADASGLVGSINVQLRLVDGVPYVFEINPRFSSTVRFRDMMGFRDLLWSLQDAFGLDIEDYISAQKGKKFYKGYQEYIDD